MKILIRKIHRWLGLLMALQIIAWMASGLYFSIFPIAEIRGEHLTRPADPLDRQLVEELAVFSTLGATLDTHLGTDWTLGAVQLVAHNGQAFWRVEGRDQGKPFTRLLDANTGSVLPALTAEEASRRASGWLQEPVAAHSVEWVDQEPGNLEIRSERLPAWKISYSEPESLSLYLHPWTGEILARRTDRWRLFDFFWMLHIMDFDSREDFNHPLLQIAAGLGLVVALSGLVFWFLSTRLFRRAKRGLTASSS